MSPNDTPAHERPGGLLCGGLQEIVRSAGKPASNCTDTNSTISLTTWEYSAIALETATKRQTNHDVLAFYAPEQGYALALSVDTTLAALVDNTGTGIGDQTVGTLAADLTYDDLLRARQYQPNWA